VKPVLLDTGVIVALLDRSERNHAHCVSAVRDLRRPLVTCEAVVAECCFLLRHLPRAAEAVLQNVVSGAFQIPFQLPPAADGVRRLMRKYRDVPIDLADACLIHLAEQLLVGEILTLDQDFTVYRWGRNRTFRLLVPPVVD
jgi:predicted nucleic acid-binding protein